MSEDSSNILIQKVSQNGTEHFVSHNEVTNFIIRNHNKNTEKIIENLYLENEKFLSEKSKIEKGFNSLCENMLEVEKNMQHLSHFYLQDNNENSQYNRLKSFGLFI